MTKLDTQAEAEKVMLYDRSELTYANSFPSFWKRLFIKTVETFTARFQLLLHMRHWENNPDKHPHFWTSVLNEMDVEIQTPPKQLENIPATGSVVVVCNHPHGLVDGVILAWILSKRREDFKIITRALLNGVAVAEKNLLSISFPHEEDAVRKNLYTRKEALRNVRDGHCVAVFPAGTVSTSKTAFGPVVEADWGKFTSKLVLQSDAQVVPVFFQGSNSRWFQIANRISDTCRQSLLMFEIKHAFHKPQSPIIGKPIGRKVLDRYKTDPEGLMAFLRAETLKLDPKAK
ncbi:MAG: lysophospholipid acyltransferase family protein [Proteobacteria bacterium]|nr:lysophospholipid acyltransferase family protein [Pseudomonadota bacterium]